MTTDLLAHPQDAVSVSGLRKTFGAVTAVDGVDLTVAPGEVVALLGPNGAGKTTTIEMLLGLSRPDSGTVRVLGLDPVAAVRSGRVGAMLQSGGLLRDLKVGETVRLVATMHRSPLPVGRALELAGIDDLVDRRIETLSGGQRQRVLFALAVVPDPGLVVLDEPTVAMDVETRRAFWSALAAAGVHADLPGAVDDVPGERRELFGWVLREGVTNVVRHSDASRVRVSVSAHSVEIVDDGTEAVTAADGSGLAGLRERLAEVGGRLDAGPVDGGGFRRYAEVPA